MSGFDVLTRGDVLEQAMQARDYLVACGVPAALAAKDPRLWGRRAVDHSRLAWLDLPFASRYLLDKIDDVVAEARYAGLDHVVLVGVGADALAAQAIMEEHAETAGALTVLDGSDTAALAFTLERLDRTMVVLASKSGVSLEGDAYLRILANAFRSAGMSDREVAARFVVITDQGSPLHGFARGKGYRVGLTDPGLPAHMAALSAYGLVPAVLAGADVGQVLDEAAALAPALQNDKDNPGLLLGAIIGGCAQRGPEGLARAKVALHEPGGSGALSGWIAQVLAAGTGKRGRGVLALEPPGSPGGLPDAHAVALNPKPGAQGAVGDAETSVWAPLGAQFLLWQYATAVAGWLLGVNPFEPGGTVAQEAEDDAAALLAAAAGGPLPTGRPVFADGDVEIHTDLPVPHHPDGLSATLVALLAQVPPEGYLSVVTYLSGEFSGRYLAPTLARHTGRPVVYGAGPGYLDATGPVHKRGPGGGAFLLVTGDPPEGDPVADTPVPGRPYGLASLQLARALAEERSLRALGLPVVRVHLRDAVEGAGRLAEAVRALGTAGQQASGMRTRATG
ncbi:phosphoheptose isomerase [Actinomadura harenae]|uniref:Phosphoheptose isomerase n=1 Tax=Actinomadura harenae TaxID=2483351 RepID=A0A3M2LZI7_9ACTN|nr:phosphoheptose isomerase [Actinomadura harenae]RMI42891.1 phosphoheptose isomerase [Actinomadura harenae]